MPGKPGGFAAEPRVALWIAALGSSSGRNVTFRRGFPERVELAIGELAQLVPSRVSLRSLVVTGVRDANVRKLVTLPAIPTLATFGLRNAHLNAKAQRRLGEVTLLITTEGLARMAVR